MEFTWTFVDFIFQGAWLLAPIFTFLASIIVVLGQIAGHREGWPKASSLYWSFITATTVGYGDIRPHDKVARFLSVIISFVGLMFTGILVALTVEAVTYSFKKNIDVETLRELEAIERQLDQRNMSALPDNCPQVDTNAG